MRSSENRDSQTRWCFYLGKTRHAESELAGFVTSMLDWKPRVDAEVLRSMNIFEAASNLAQAYRLNGKSAEAVGAASLALDYGAKWAADDEHTRLRVAIRSLALEAFGLLDEPHRQLQESLLKNASLPDDVIEQARAIFRRKASPEK